MTLSGKLLPRIKISKGNVVPKCNKGRDHIVVGFTTAEGGGFIRGVHCKPKQSTLFYP